MSKKSCLGCVEWNYALPGEIQFSNGNGCESGRRKLEVSSVVVPCGNVLYNMFRMGRTKPQSVSPDYVVGLTDGEGCFYVQVRNSRLYRSGASVQLHFHIKMQEADREVLHMIKLTLGCGEVYFQHETRPNHVQCYRYTVSAHRDILGKVIPFFQRYPLRGFSKQNNFLLFSKIAAMVDAKKHLSREGIEKIRKLKAKMNQRQRGLA